MRWLFLSVLVFNVAYIVWEMGQSSENRPVIKSSSKEVPPLILISELSPEDVIAEVTTEKVTTDSVSQDKPVEKPETEKLAATCYTLGPFRELSSLRKLTRAIKNYVIDASFRSREEQETAMYWVYIMPQENRETAHKISKRLSNNNIRDYYIITTGEKNNGISLGHFKVRKSAFAHARRLKKLGFKPEIEPVLRTYVIYWLDYRVKSGRQLPEEIINRHLSTGISQLNRRCE